MDLAVKKLLETALVEDIGSGDVTSLSIIPETARAEARILAKQDLVLAGIDVGREVFYQLDAEVRFIAFNRDGDRVKAGSEMATVEGSARTLLAGERVALNLLQHLSGIATLTAAYVERLRGLKAVVLDTRKTLPGLRQLEKYAVRIGGGRNHRAGLYDGILIKDNHIAAAGSITRAVEAARAAGHHLLKIEVETKNIAEVREALAARADVIMLDNMSPAAMGEAVREIKGRALVEASGNVTLDTLRSIAETGVDFISAGAITHSAPAADISMKIK